MLNEYTEDINVNIQKIIEDDKIKYEISERCQEHTLKVNKALFYGFESILKIITSNKDLYIKLLNEKNISKFIDNCKEIFNQVNKFNNILKLNSKEILTLQEIIALIDGLITNNILTSENLNKILDYFSGKTENELEIQNSFKIFFEDLKIIFENNKNQNYYKLISIVFKNEFMKYFDNNEFKKKVIEIITTDIDNGYISNNYQLFKIILEFNIEPSKIKQNLNNIKDDEVILKIKKMRVMLICLKN